MWVILKGMARMAAVRASQVFMVTVLVVVAWLGSVCVAHADTNPCRGGKSGVCPMLFV